MSSREDLMEALDAIETGMCRVKEPGHLAERAGVCPVSGREALADGEIKEKQR